MRALHLKSMEYITNCKKKEFKELGEIQLGDSQYSTFSAQIEGRKKAKKKTKKIKNDAMVEKPLTKLKK